MMNKGPKTMVGTLPKISMEARRGPYIEDGCL